MEKRRVVITGMGAVTPIGLTAAESWAAAKAGVCGIGPITQYDPSFRVVIPYENMMTTVNTGRTVDDTDNVWLNSRIRLVELLVLDRYWIPHEEFMNALNNTDTAYVVYDLDGPCHDYLQAAGLAEIARTENYVIYKYGWYFDELHRSRGYVKFQF